ncbi:MAG: diguanylate cyclase [Nitrospinota bacterium]|nr:diguanylate cyclase [Nitrospinota bacterium]MDH5678423.1 diguanylate cyclase [Nitrospinota bacterium]MDH5757035.1 diguanylate cyclase [Nitrospinota bacterium]
MKEPSVYIVSKQDVAHEALAEALKVEGYRVTMAPPGPETLESISTTLPEIAIIDMEGGDNGRLKLCRALKTNEGTRGISLLIASETDVGRSVWEGVNQWADDFLKKPLDHNELFARLRIHLRMHEYHMKLEKLVFFARKIYARDLEGIAQAMREEFTTFVRADRYSVFVAEEDGRKMRLLVHNHGEGEMDHMEVSLESSPIMAEARRSLKPVLETNFSGSSFNTGASREKYSDDFALCVPLYVGEDYLGALNLNGNQAGFFNRLNMDLLALIGEILSAAINNALRLETLRRLAITDGLTGLLNHRSFHERLSSEFERSRRFSTPLTCVMVDIDFFKKINDKHGHQSGDMILSSLATRLKRHLRKIDIVARYGGEEFALLLPQTAARDALVVAERIREDVGASRFETMGGKIKVTISLGIADSAGAGVLSGADLLNRADKAMYKAKKGGRDRSDIFEESV